MDEISYSDSAQPKRRIGKRVLFFGILLVIILALAGSAFYFVTKGNPTQDSKTITLDEPEETTQTPTPADSDIKKTEIELAVQNGSGTAGVAASAAAILETEGYQIVSTGNADNFEYEDIVIRVKKGNENLIEALSEDLADDYTIGSTSADLAESSAYDGLVIVGQ